MPTPDMPPVATPAPPVPPETAPAPPDAWTKSEDSEPQASTTTKGAQVRAVRLRKKRCISEQVISQCLQANLLLDDRGEIRSRKAGIFAGFRVEAIAAIGHLISGIASSRGADAIRLGRASDQLVWRGRLCH